MAKLRVRANSGIENDEAPPSRGFESAPCWARTSDPQLVELVLSQLS
jgi:hypothetical protein